MLSLIHISDAVQQIEHTEPCNVCYYRDFQVVVEEVFRFDQEDTVVFKVRFENKGGSEIYYQPQRLAIRVGQDVYCLLYTSRCV